jgi:hypothetical protein
MEEILMKEYLPIGSIVLLENGEKKIMIYGRKQQAVATNEEYDYVACLYPEGNINEDFTYLFNHSDIREVIFTGFTDEDENTFLEQLNSL